MGRVPDRIIREIINAKEKAQWGETAFIIDYYAHALKLSKQSLWYQLKQYDPKRDRKGESDPRRIEAVRIVFAIRAEFADDGRYPSLEAIIKFAEGRELFDIGLLSISTCRCIAYKLGFGCNNRIYHRYEAQRANQEHSVDFSGSEYFGVEKDLPDDDYLLVVKNKGESGTYKNKEDNTSKRVWIGAIVDRHSRVVYHKYYVAAGEGGFITADLLESAWKKKTDNPMYGLPENLQTDNSSFFKSNKAKNMFAELGINHKPHKPYNPNAKGIVEIRFRYLWSGFEKFFTLPSLKYKKLKLSELNELLSNYCCEQNTKRHPIIKHRCRDELYLESLAGQTVRLCPENFDHYIFFEMKRTPNNYGVINVDNKEWLIIDCDPKMLKRTVNVFKNIRGEIVVQNPIDKKIYGVEQFESSIYGDYKGVAITPQERLTRSVELPEFEHQDLSYGKAPEKRESNIVYLSRSDIPEDETPYTPVRQMLSWEKKKEIFTANIGYSFCSITEILGEKRNEKIIAKLKEFETEEEIINLAQQLLPLIEQTEMFEAAAG